MQNKRLDYLDFIKGIAAVLVVFCHQVVIPDESVAGSIGIMLSFAAVPCFMMCSGYVLLFRRERAGRSFQRAAHVYLCMAVWKLVYLLYFSLFEPLKTDAISVFRYLFLFCPLQGVETEHFWFLQAYLPAMLLVPLLAPMFAERRVGMAAAFTALAYLSNQFVMSANLVIQLASARLGFAAFDMEMLSHVFPMGGEYSSMLVCFLLGGIHRLLEEKGISRKPLFAGFAALCTVGGLAVMLFVRYLQMGSLAWHGTMMVAKYEWSSTLMMSFGLFSLLRCIGEGRAARWIGRHIGRCSMGVFYLHYLCLIPLVRFVYPLLPNALWVNIAKSVIVCAVCVVLTKAARRIPLVRNLVK